MDKFKDEQVVTPQNLWMSRSFSTWQDEKQVVTHVGS